MAKLEVHPKWSKIGTTKLEVHLKLFKIKKIKKKPYKKYQ